MDTYTAYVCTTTTTVPPPIPYSIDIYRYYHRGIYLPAVPAGLLHFVGYRQGAALQAGALRRRGRLARLTPLVHSSPPPGPD